MITLLYIVSCGIMFTHTLAYTFEEGYIQFPYFVKYGIAITWFSVSLLYTIYKGKGKIRKSYFKDIVAFALPLVLMILSVFISYLINHNYTSDYLNRSISNIFVFAVTIFTVYGISNMFRDKAIIYSLYGVCIASFINIIYTISIYGITPVLYVMLNTVKTSFIAYDPGSIFNEISYSLEVADATFAYGFFFLYYFMFAVKNKERNRALILCIIGMYIGFKRIEIVALLISIFIFQFFIKRKNLSRKRIQLVFTSFLILFACLYLFLMKYHVEVFMFLDQSRVNMYNHLKNLYELSPFYIGKGYGYVNKWLEVVSSKYWIMSVSHSDFVRMYIELGAIGFLLWICYYTIYLPQYFYKKASTKAGNIVLSFVIVIMITYLIDNTTTLFATQFSFILIPIATNMFEKNNKERGIKIE